MSRLLVVLVLAITVTVSGPAAAAATPSANAGDGAFDVKAPLDLTGAYAARAPDGLGLAYGGGGGDATGDPDDTFSLRMHGETVQVVREYSRVSHLTGPVTGAEMYTYEWDDRRETETFSAASVRAAFAGDSATAFLHRGGGDTYRATLAPSAGADGGTAAHLTTNGPRKLETVDAQENPYVLRHDVRYPHLSLTVDDGVLRAVGNFTLFVWDVDFRVHPQDGAVTEFRTGERETSGTATFTRTEVANALIRVENGALEMRGAAFTELITPEVDMVVNGSVTLPDATGVYRTADATYAARGEDVDLSGHVDLTFRVTDAPASRATATVAGTLTAISLTPASTSGIPVPGGAPALALGSGLALFIGVGAVVAARTGRAPWSRREAPYARGMLVVPRLRRRTPPLEEAVDAMAAGDAAAAAARFERLLRERPDDVVLLVDHGTVLERLGRLRDARDALERAVGLEPGHGEAHYYYSRVLAKLGLTASALPHLQRALALDPRLKEMAGGDAEFRSSLGDHPMFLSLVG